MESRRIRLGDVIDDYCTRCGLLMNHGVVGMIGDEVRKVRCNTCMYEHVYKHARLPKRKRDATKKLFNEVLRGLGREESTEDESTVDSAAARSASNGPAAGSEADSEARSARSSSPAGATRAAAMLRAKRRGREPNRTRDGHR